jgi:hypothetical protein
MTIARNQNEAPYEGARESSPAGRGHVLTRSIPDSTTAPFRPDGPSAVEDDDSRPLAAVVISPAAD